MTKLSGYLEDAVGVAIPNCTIELKAQKTTLSVITKTSAFSSPNGEGYYEMEVKPGQYSVTLLMDGYSPKHVGEITIYLDSPDGTLNDFLLVPNSNEIKPELITALEEVRYENKQIVEKAKQEVEKLAQDTQSVATQTEQNIQHIAEQTAEKVKESFQLVEKANQEVQKLAQDTQNIASQTEQNIQHIADQTIEEIQKSSQAAIDAKNEVQNSLSSVVKKSGDVINGNLDFNGSGNGVSFSHNDDKHYIYEDSSGNLIFELKGSDEPKIRLRWNKETNTWEFDNCNVTKNSVNILSTGDFGLGARSPLLPAGSDFSSDLVTSSNNEFTLSGKYIGTPDDSKVWEATLTVKRRLYDVSGACTLILFSEGNYYIKYGHKNTDLWVWSNWEKIILSSGGTLTGDLNINKEEPAIVFNSSNDSFRWFLGQNNTSGFQGMGDDGLKTRFRWINATKTWDFESCNVTKNSKNLLVDGEYGLGSKNLFTESKFTDDITKQVGAFQASMPAELPNSIIGHKVLGCAGLTIPYRTDESPFSYRILFSADPYGATSKIPAVFFQEYALDGWGKPIEAITTANIDNYLPKMVILYPQGTEGNPPIISINSRIVIDNPFPGHSVICMVEVKFQDKWGAPGFIYSAGGYGVKAHQYDDDQIIVQSGNMQVLNGPLNTGSPHPNASLTSAPFRVKVWKLT